DDSEGLGMTRVEDFSILLDEMQLLFDRYDARLARQLEKEAQALAVLLIQRIIDILDQVNLNIRRIQVELQRVFSGDVINVSKAELPRRFEVFAAVGEILVFVARPEGEDKWQSRKLFPFCGKVVNLCGAAIGERRITD